MEIGRNFKGVLLLYSLRLLHLISISTVPWRAAATRSMTVQCVSHLCIRALAYAPLAHCPVVCSKSRLWLVAGCPAICVVKIMILVCIGDYDICFFRIYANIVSEFCRNGAGRHCLSRGWMIRWMECTAYYYVKLCLNEINAVTRLSPSMKIA